jgi:rod shape-determining protein MreB
LSLYLNYKEDLNFFVLFSKISKLISAPDVAIDLGTANTRLYAAGSGLVADQPTMVKINYQSNSDISNSKKFVIIEEESDFVMPLEGGCRKKRFCSFYSAQTFDSKGNRLWIWIAASYCVRSKRRFQPRAFGFICSNTISRSFGSDDYPEPLAASIGAGLDVSSPYAQMLVDIGDGVTDVAVIRNGKLIQTTASGRRAAIFMRLFGKW